MLLKLVPANTNFPFIKLRKIAFIISALALIASGVLFFAKGLNYGIDFEGGVMIQIKADVPIDLKPVRAGLNKLGLGEVKVQEKGTPEEIMIRTETQDDMSNDEIQILVKDTLKHIIPGEVDYGRKAEAISPVVSGELVADGIKAITLAIFGVLVYLWFRFEWQFGLGSVIALIHDVVLTIGLFSLLGLEFNLSIIAAILTIVGYSLNDTVVVYDRIRENLRRYRKKEVDEVINLSLNETLSRTIMTSVTTLLALAALFYFGGAILHGFTAAMIWGVLVGTYSSVFIASPMLLWFEMRREDDDAAVGVEVLPPKH
jgi:preprotein translocase SecF subunit